MSAPDDIYCIPAQAIYLAAFIRNDDKAFRDDAPVTSHVLRTLQSSLVGYGWRLQFGSPDYLTCGYWTIQVRDLIDRDRMRSFPPVHGFEGIVRSANSMNTVGEIIRYCRFIEILVKRNITVDRMLNFAGLYDGFDGTFMPDDIVSAEEMFRHMQDAFVLLEEETAQRRDREGVMAAQSRHSLVLDRMAGDVPAPGDPPELNAD
jgi:hypothetical protein